MSIAVDEKIISRLAVFQPRSEIMDAMRLVGKQAVAYVPVVRGDRKISNCSAIIDQRPIVIDMIRENSRGRLSKRDRELLFEEIRRPAQITRVENDDGSIHYVFEETRHEDKPIQFFYAQRLIVDGVNSKVFMRGRGIEVDTMPIIRDSRGRLNFLYFILAGQATRDQVVLQLQSFNSLPKDRVQLQVNEFRFGKKPRVEEREFLATIESVAIEGEFLTPCEVFLFRRSDSLPSDPSIYDDDDSSQDDTTDMVEPETEESPSIMPKSSDVVEDDEQDDATDIIVMNAVSTVLTL